MAAKADRLGVFLHLTWSGRARNCLRKRRTHVTRWLGYWARTVRPAVADPLGHLAFVIRWERGEIGGLPHCHILISRFPERSNQSEYVFCYGKHVEARNLTSSPV